MPGESSEHRDLGIVANSLHELVIIELGLAMDAMNGRLCTNVHPKIQFLFLESWKRQRLVQRRCHEHELATGVQNFALIFLSFSTTLNPAIKHRKILQCRSGKG